MTPGQRSLIGLAGFAAGAVNALAGGGTLLSFPALLAAGLPAVAANVTSTIALCPGYLGAALAQRTELAGQRSRVLTLLPAAIAGGLGGAVLLLHTSATRFTALVPWLLLLACALLAVQESLRAVLALRTARELAGTRRHPASALARAALPLGVAAAAVYGGYFGAGMSVLLLAVLGLGCADALPRLNALKQLLALGANFAAACWLAAGARVDWELVALLAGGALLGGAAGGRGARRLPARWLRRVIVVLGLALALYYLLRPR